MHPKRTTELCASHSRVWLVGSTGNPVRSFLFRPLTPYGRSPSVAVPSTPSSSLTVASVRVAKRHVQRLVHPTLLFGSFRRKRTNERSACISVLRLFRLPYICLVLSGPIIESGNVQWRGPSGQTGTERITCTAPLKSALGVDIVERRRPGQGMSLCHPRHCHPRK